MIRFRRQETWYESGVQLPESLLSILVCPSSKQPLIYFPRGEDGADEGGAFLLCPASRLRYRIDDGVPVMLADEATAVAETEVRRLVERADSLGLRLPA